MKKLLGIILVFAMLFTCTAMAESTAVAPAKDIVVLFTSDVHCGVDQGFGYAGLAAIRDQLVAQGSYVTLVDNGDSIQGEPIGTMTTGEAIIDLMNTVGYDVAIPGNHEFDYGMDRFLELTKKAKYPYISANFTKDGALVFDAYKIIDYDGVKVAYVGVTTPKTITSSTPKYFQDGAGNFIYGFSQDNSGEKLYAAVQTAVDAARAEGANYVVAMGHLGIEEECSPYMSTEVIANTTGIDAMLDGHSHSVLPQEKVLNKDGAEVVLSACGTKMQGVGQLTINTEGEISSTLYTWDNEVSAPALLGLTGAVNDAVTTAMDTLSETLQTVVAKSEVDLTITAPDTDPAVRIIRNAETNLGDLCADAYRVMSGADIAFVNGGGIRVSIAAGDVTLNDILKVHPFGNAMCTVEASGQEILDALEWGARAVPAESGAFLQVSGLTYEIHTDVESTTTQDENGMFTGVAGEYRVQNVLVDGEPLDLAKTYILASHNYLLKNGGDGFNMFMDNTILQDEVMLDNQVLINYITESLGGVIGEQYAEPYGGGRIVAVPAADAE